MSSNLVIPIVAWGQKAPTHRICSIAVTSNSKRIVTGCRDGQLVMWEHLDSVILPRFMMFGHTSSVLSIVWICEQAGKLASASDAGELCLWDVSDGRCLEQVQLPGSPTHIYACDLALRNEMQKCILCFGQFSEISVLSASSLQVLITLASRIFPDWISAAVIMPWDHIPQSCNILGLTVSGMFKVWHVHKSCTQAVLFEEESKQISCPMALGMKLSSSNCCLLIICSNFWLICDSSDYSVLCSEKCESDQQLVGGDFLGSDSIILWSRKGKVFMFKLPFSASSQELFRSSLQSQTQATAHLMCHFSVASKQQQMLPPAATLNQNFFVMGTCNGDLTLSEINENGSRHVQSSSLTKLWNTIENRPVGIIDNLGSCSVDNQAITATLYISRYSYLCCGREDGSIVVVPAAKTCRVHLCFESRKVHLPHKTLLGHRDRVTYILYPFQDEPDSYSPQLLLSGSADFSVILWDLFTGVLIHSFHVHGGEITQLLIPPARCNPRIRQSICSVAQDHSVALLNLRDRKCILMASRHPSPITAIRWRPDDDFLIVLCEDSTVFVWQMETGHLDRFEQGSVAADIIAACDQLSQTHVTTISQNSINLSQALKTRSLTLFKTVAQQSLRSLIEGFESQKNVTETHDKGDDKYKAMMISPLRANPLHDSDSHVIFFNTEALIARLLMEHSRKTRNKIKYSDDSGPLNKTGVLTSLVKQIRNQLLDDDSDLSSSDVVSPKRKNNISSLEVDCAVDAAQIIVSCLHAWGVDNNIDTLCKDRLGLLMPRSPIAFGVLSPHGHMTLHLPSTKIKQCWSLLATLHCVLLPEKMERFVYKPPRLELLARRWQDRCLELREASQALMLAELRQMGSSGRRRVVETWSRHVPDYAYQPTVDAPPLDSSASYIGPDEIGDRSSVASDELVASFPSAAKLPDQVRRRHATAIVILGVIGAEFGQELEPCGPQRRDVPDGFGLSDYSLARHTCKALVYLLLQPPSPKLPAFVPLRRAAIDLLGRGFTVWEPYMEVSAVLLGLLELCESYAKHIGDIQSGFPLSPEADSCRSAHHSLSLIATARPLTFITTIAREVARYNAAAANPQHQSLLATSVLVRTKSEILRIIELLSDKMMSDLNSVLVEVVDIALFCIDISVLRASHGLLEAVPALAKFHTISYDSRSRRVAVAGARGSIVLYDIRSCKHQVVTRGPGRITALCFSPDGRYLCVYCASENQLSFWVTATTLFGMIQSQVKCVKTLSPLKTRSKPAVENLPHKLNLAKLVWVNGRSVVLLTSDGSEHRFHI